MIDWQKERIYLFAHSGWGLAITLILARHLSIAHAAFATFIFAGAKEAAESLWGLWDNPKPPWSSFFVDTFEFLIGILLAVIVLRYF